MASSATALTFATNTPIHRQTEGKQRDWNGGGEGGWYFYPKRGEEREREGHETNGGGYIIFEKGPSIKYVRADSEGGGDPKAYVVREVA